MNRLAVLPYTKMSIVTGQVPNTKWSSSAYLKLEFMRASVWSAKRVEDEGLVNYRVKGGSNLSAIKMNYTNLSAVKMNYTQKNFYNLEI